MCVQCSVSVNDSFLHFISFPFQFSSHRFSSFLVSDFLKVNGNKSPPLTELFAATVLKSTVSAAVVVGFLASRSSWCHNFQLLFGFFLSTPPHCINSVFWYFSFLFFSVCCRLLFKKTNTKKRKKNYINCLLFFLIFYAQFKTLT